MITRQQRSNLFTLKNQFSPIHLLFCPESMGVPRQFYTGYNSVLYQFMLNNPEAREASNTVRMMYGRMTYDMPTDPVDVNHVVEDLFSKEFCAYVKTLQSWDFSAITSFIQLCCYPSSPFFYDSGNSFPDSSQLKKVQQKHFIDLYDRIYEKFTQHLNNTLINTDTVGMVSFILDRSNYHFDPINSGKSIINRLDEDFNNHGYINFHVYIDRAWTAKGLSDPFRFIITYDLK